MPPPVFRFGQIVIARSPVPARLCSGSGWRAIELAPATYRIIEISRREAFRHDSENSDGYTYRLAARNGPLRKLRISVWQNDLADAVWGWDGE